MHELPVLTPVDEAGRFYPEYGWLAGRSAHEAADDIVGDLGERGLLVAAGTITHRYPECWRCHTPLIFRISDDWFISVARDPRADARGQPHRRVDARVHGQAHGRLARQHGRLEHLPPPLLRPAAAVLPVLVRAPHRRRLAGRAGGAAPPGRSTGSRSCAGPGSTTVPIRCPQCGEDVTRIAEVGDVWLDAGIVPFSTLGWENPEWIDQGLRAPARPRA